MSTANLIKKLEEIKKKIVIRQGKKIKINQPKEGYRVVGNKYVKIQPGEARKRRKSAIIAARGRRGKQSQATRQRAKSMRKRASMGEAAFGFESDEYEYFDANDSIYEYEDECECDECQMGLPCPCDELEESVDLKESDITSIDGDIIFKATSKRKKDSIIGILKDEKFYYINRYVNGRLRGSFGALTDFDDFKKAIIDELYNYYIDGISLSVEVDRYAIEQEYLHKASIRNESFLNEACPEGSDPRGGKCARSDKSGYLKGRCDKGFIWDTKRDTCERMAKENLNESTDKFSKYFSYKV